jgi:ATP-independent RNA helicase DbpA
MSAFSSLPLSPALLQALDALGHAEMTAVQAQSLPALLAGRDAIVQAPTGSGKTVAFGLGLLQPLDVALAKPQALVLCPTRELADQVARTIRRLAGAIANLKVLLLTGGVAPGPQLASLRKEPHVVVGTPGRVQEMLRRGALDLARVRTLVLDEADRMLDMGFEEPIRDIAGRAPQRRQTLLFSATYPEAIRRIGRDLLRDAVEITVGGEASRPAIEQVFFEVQPERRPAALAALLQEYAPSSAVVFCNTRRDVDELAAALGRAGALALHGDLEQRERDEVLVRFANRSCGVLVASDVAARGLDIEELGAVVNYELPPDPDVYLHRIGRTARAGRSGVALSLVAPREMPRALAVEARQGAPLRWAQLQAAARSGGLPSPPMATLRIDAGRTDKMRPGDILGALTGAAGLPAEAVGKIDVFATRSYVAIRRTDAARALDALRAGKVKGRTVRVARL